jgi:hypothetical protein
MCWACTQDAETRTVHRLVVGKSHGKQPLEGLERTWQDNIKTDLRKVSHEVDERSNNAFKTSNKDVTLGWAIT